MIKPIPIYDKYYFVDHNKKLFGFTDEGLKKITIYDENDKEIKIADFYKETDIFYFSVLEGENTVHYKQENNAIEIIDTFPKKISADNYAEYESENWIVGKAMYKESLLSRVLNKYLGKGTVFFTQIDNYYEERNGIYFNVIKSQKNQNTATLYFFPKKKTTCEKIKELGKMY